MANVSNKVVINGRLYDFPGAEPFEEILEKMGATDITKIADGTVTGAIAEHDEQITQLNNDLSALKSHVGMIIHSTTLDTEAKVIAIYGGTSWSKIEGRFLLGQSSSYAINSTGGSKDAIVVSHTHNAAHNHLIADGSGRQYGAKDGTVPGNVQAGYLWGIATVNGGKTTQTAYAQWNDFNVSTVGQSSTDKNMPPYKTVYIWERTA